MGKDPNKPRGRTTAYAFFVMEEKEKYQQVKKSFKKVKKKFFLTSFWPRAWWPMSRCARDLVFLGHVPDHEDIFLTRKI